ncbi:hypothetical protein AVEN_173605-1 [Araneus ventricosus]|uniref:Uncharacterized protein n=1 Tax=Araneus ventricosus TaxID=182803 RepID=A0A4Y2CQW4_ARAVE|nr:hypothetical protein AVEN_173605-1 [Araneus ventricosus]
MTYTTAPCNANPVTPILEPGFSDFPDEQHTLSLLSPPHTWLLPLILIYGPAVQMVLRISRPVVYPTFRSNSHRFCHGTVEFARSGAVVNIQP